MAQYLDRFTSSFQRALQNARTEGEIAKDSDLAQVAGYLTTCMVGISASIRAEAPEEQIWATYEMVCATLEHLAART